jgi:hypothetical protein
MFSLFSVCVDRCLVVLVLVLVVLLLVLVVLVVVLLLLAVSFVCVPGQNLAMTWERSSAHFDYVRALDVNEATGVFVTGGGDGRVRAFTIKVRRKPRGRARSSQCSFLQLSASRAPGATGYSFRAGS